jgi:hypothetical protein
MFDDVPPVVRNVLVAELAPGERVLWHAMPSLGRTLRDPILILLFAVLVAYLVVLMLLFHHLAALFPQGPPLGHFEATIDLILFGGSSGIFALGLLIIWRCLFRRVLYAITDRRAILIQVFFRRRIQSFTGEQLIRATRIEDKRGGGDIIFERYSRFSGLKDVRAVAKLLRQTYEAGLQA